MAALRKPHRIAFLAPSLAVEGADAPYTREAALLLWSALIETCQRHPGLAVYDPESTPVFPLDGHFAPQHAALGASPSDSFWASTRRDELVWLELALPKAPVVRLHTLGRDGARETFEAVGRNVGEQIQHALGAWLTARGLGALPRRFEHVAAEELLAVVRVIGPHLIEQARKWTAHVAREEAVAEDVGADDELAELGAPDAAGAGGSPGGGDEATATVLGPPIIVEPPAPGAAGPAAGAAPGILRRPPARPGRALAHRLPAALKVPALRALELALREDLGDLILAADADHPRALFAQYLARAARAKDHALLRRVIAQSPGWARPYGELAHDGGAAPAAPDDDAPTALEAVAGAGIAALCRPGHLDIIEAAAAQLRADGRADEALRLMERAVRLHDAEPRAHTSLLRLHRATGRVGPWLAQAQRSARAHGCPQDPFLPWYPDQLQLELQLADALRSAGRLDEAIALRAHRLDGREAAWPRHAQILERWRREPKLLARCYAREGHFRGDPARALEGLGRAAPAGDTELAIWLDALVALGREAEAPLAWAHAGFGLGHPGPAARLAAARALLIAGDWRRGLEELWRVSLAEPGRDEQAAIARVGLLASSMPLDVAETALAERMTTGATTLARRMARDVADFLPHAGKSSIVLRALGLNARTQSIDFDPAWLASLDVEPAARRALDELFADAAGDPLARADRLVDRWHDAVCAHASEDEPAALAQAAAYVAAHALGRYLAGTTAAPSPLTGGLRLVAAEALALVRRHRDALCDRDARALLGVFEPLLRRVDRWVGAAWLAAAERSCGIDERAGGDVAGFVRESATVAARILGPEEVAVLSASVARLHRERPEGWESATVAQAGRLALHTGFTGVEEWADATVAQLATRAQDGDDAVDALLTACYLAEGKRAGPCVHAARVLFDAGRSPAALAVLTAGLPAASPELRARHLAALADAWKRSQPGLPHAFEQAFGLARDALDKGDAARAEKLGRWSVALDPDHLDAHRQLAQALARQGKAADALVHFTRAAAPGEHPPQVLAGALVAAGKHGEAGIALDYASRWYTRPAEWIGYAALALAAGDPLRAAEGYAHAHRLDPALLDPAHLDAYAGALAATGDYAGCERIAQALRRAAGGDPVLVAQALLHLARACIRQDRFDEAAELAAEAGQLDADPERAAAYHEAFAHAQARTKPEPPAAARESRPEGSWRAHRAALVAARHRGPAEGELPIAPRARAVAAAALALTSGLGRPAAPGASVEREVVFCRLLALELREQAHFARDGAPPLGEQLSRAAFHRELRARGGAILDEPPAPPPAFTDRVIVPGGQVARASDYVALLRELAALTPREALAQLDLDEAGYLEVARAWADALDADPSTAALITAGLAKR